MCSVQGKVYSGKESLPEVLELASKSCLKLVSTSYNTLSHCCKLTVYLKVNV